MEKKKNITETDKIFEDIVHKELPKYTCQLFIEVDGELTPHASGILVRINNKTFLLTASHVTSDNYGDLQLYIRVKSGYISVVGFLQDTDLSVRNDIDLAYVILDEEVVKVLKDTYSFLPLSKLRKHSVLKHNTNYCVMGFPVSNQKKEGKILKTWGTSFIVDPSKDKVYDFHKLDKKINHVFEFKGKGTNIKSGKYERFNNELYGLSGGGLWLIDIYEYNGSSFIDYKLIGIMTEFRKVKHYCIVACRLEILLNQLKENGIISYKEKKTI